MGYSNPSIKKFTIVGWMLIIVGILSALFNFFLAFSGAIPTGLDLLYLLGLRFLGSILFFVIFFFPGKYYLNLSKEKSKQNKLTNISLWLTIVGVLLIVIAFLVMLTICPPKTNICEIWGLLILYGGIILAGVPYSIGVILLIINKVKK